MNGKEGKISVHYSLVIWVRWKHSRAIMDYVFFSANSEAAKATVVLTEKNRKWKLL